MKVLFAPETSDHQNWGCRLMGAAFRATLQDNGAQMLWRIPSAWFYRPNPELPELTRMADIRALAQRVGRGQVLVDLAKVLRACDLVFLNGENFIRPGTAKGRRLLLLAYLAKAVFNKPCVLSNVSLDLDEPELAEIAAEVLPLLDEVHVREENSVERAAGLFTPERWRRVPDIAWASPAAPLSEWAELARRPGHFSAWPDMAESFDPLRPYVTVCASSAFSLPEHQGVDAAPAFIELCRRLQAEIAPVLLTAPDEPDLIIMRKVQAALGLPLLGIHLPVRQAIDVLGNACVHVGGRWHPGIFAATGGTPQVALNANSHKMHSLMRQLGSEDPVFDVLRVDQHVEDIMALAKRQVDAGPALRERLQARSRELAAQVPAGMDFVRRQAGDSSEDRASR